MNITKATIQLLHQQGKIKVPGFGVFSIYNAGAVFDSVTKTILPPEKHYRFLFNYFLEDAKLAKFLALENKTTEEVAMQQITQQVEIWKKQALNQEPIDFEEIGKFLVLDGKYSFMGNPVLGKSPDFFGLEKININEINNKTSQSEHPTTTATEFQLQKSFLWIFLLVIPILAMVYFAITQKELLFGKKSFDISIQNSTHRIKDNNVKTTPETVIENSKNAKDSSEVSVKTTP